MLGAIPELQRHRVQHWPLRALDTTGGDFHDEESQWLHLHALWMGRSLPPAEGVQQ